MIDKVNQPFPKKFIQIDEATQSSGFTMASDPLTCSLLRTLALSKSRSRLLELGTGTGLSTSWILDGMDQNSCLVSIDNELRFLEIAERFLGDDKRLNLVHIDGADWIVDNGHEKFDFIFADTWHGKYLMLDEVLSMLNTGGIYIIDDMLPQPNWPEGHDDKAKDLIDLLEKRTDLVLTKLTWATGIIIATKKAMN